MCINNIMQIKEYLREKLDNRIEGVVIIYKTLFKNPTNHLIHPHLIQYS